MPVQSQTIAMIQRVTAGFLTDVCTIEAETAARGEFGEPLHTWSSVASSVPCRLIRVGRKSSGSGVTAGQETLVQEYLLIVKTNATLAVDQRVTINGLVYNVVRFETQLTDEAFQSAILMRR